MIYNNELVNYKQSRGLQYFQASTATNYFKFLISSLSKTSIHGVQQLALAKQRVVIACFWLALVVCATFGSIAMYLILSERHNEQQLKTVVETSQLPVYNIEFPAVAVCPWNRVNWMRLKAGEKRFLPANASAETRAVFKQVLIAMAQMAFGRFNHLVELNKYNVQLVQNLSLTELSQFFSKRCDEIFEPGSCEFDGTPHDCCKLFVSEYTEKGICLTFNSLISEESRKITLSFPNYPWKIKKAGEGTGLKFSLRYNSSYELDGFLIPFAFTLMIKAPRDWSTPLVHYLVPNTHNFISVNPQITVTSKNTKGLQPTKRRCLFNEEKPIEFHKWVLDYSQLNCLARCQKVYLKRICNCSTQMYFPNAASICGQVNECNPTHLRCFYENRDIFSYIKVPRQDQFIEDNRRGMLCECLPSCYSINYLLMQNVKKINVKPNKNAHNTTIFRNDITSEPSVKADIHFAQRTIIKYSTRLEYTLMDLLANFGGILGLFLGASSLSLVEICLVAIKMLAKLYRDRQAVRPVMAAKFQRKLTPAQ